VARSLNCANNKLTELLTPGGPLQEVVPNLEVLNFEKNQVG
jgi:hypothetical protein